MVIRGGENPYGDRPGSIKITNARSGREILSGGPNAQWLRGKGTFMISVKECRILLGNSTAPTREIETIRDGLTELAEIFMDMRDRQADDPATGMTGTAAPTPLPGGAKVDGRFARLSVGYRISTRRT